MRPWRIRIAVPTISVKMIVIPMIGAVKIGAVMIGAAMFVALAITPALASQFVVFPKAEELVSPD